MQAVTTIGFDRTINVRSWGKTGQHMLALSLTAFDPGCVKTLRLA